MRFRVCDMVKVWSRPQTLVLFWLEVAEAIVGKKGGVGCSTHLGGTIL